MSTQPIPGFKALAFKERAQQRVQAELQGLSPAEEARKLAAMVSTGRYAHLVRRWRSARLRGGATDQDHQDDAA